MSNPRAQEIPNPEAGVSRRSFIRKGGAALAAELTMPAIPVEAASQGHPNPKPGRHPNLKPSPTRPNLLILITDQERFPQHWPEGWADRNLLNRKRLERHGLTFTRAYCNAAMCSPSRATLFTGLYDPQHGVLEVLETGSATNTYPYGQMTLRTGLMNMAKMLENAGYDVQFRGKWHMSRDRQSDRLGAVWI
ncbi:MAG TPA: sulfatase-like hydrolase/transferase [Candidatus Paceibacterota bacterium]|nr:sulfatase-like hydrolase/transferase [Verrucomicrobiota bacterium]HRY50366.1 sulfatase-like hydrolase/transferase [Candidatus Paceibacterota bacterium]